MLNEDPHYPTCVQTQGDQTTEIKPKSPLPAQHSIMTHSQIFLIKVKSLNWKTKIPNNVSHWGLNSTTARAQLKKVCHIKLGSSWPVSEPHLAVEKHRPQLCKGPCSIWWTFSGSNFLVSVMYLFRFFLQEGRTATEAD